MSRKLFGTDGVRGVAGPGGLLTAELTLALAQAAIAVIGSRGGGVPAPDGLGDSLGNERARVLIIRDTRESGQMLEAAMATGIASAGGDAVIGGVLPTPAAPLLVRRHGFALAAVISASHNPFEDNGIKFFAADGFKLDDETERQIEARLSEPFPEPVQIGRVQPFVDALEDYLAELQERFSTLDLTGRRILLDCANGATFRAAPELFRRLGAHVQPMNDDPNGRNINANCGSTHIEGLVEAMRAGDYDIGFAFDGDGDRLLAVDRRGEVVDGDELIALVASHQRRSGTLGERGVAVTVMTNFGFHTAMAEAEIDVATTAVGDRYVMEELRKRGWHLGGEQSGHIIDLSFGLSGDGIASALLVLEALGDGDLADRQAMSKLPQRLINVRAQSRPALDGAMASAAVQGAVEGASRQLGDRGRVLVRVSGTEPLIRVMVEAPTQAETDDVCRTLVSVVESQLQLAAAGNRPT